MKAFPPRRASSWETRSTPAIVILFIATWTSVFIYYYSNRILIIEPSPSPSKKNSYLLCYLLSIIFCSTDAFIYLQNSISLAESTESVLQNPKLEDRIKTVVSRICNTASLSVFSSLWTDILTIVDEVAHSWADDAWIINKILAMWWTFFGLAIWFFPLFMAWVVTVTDWIALWDSFGTGKEACDGDQFEEMEEGKCYWTIVKELERKEKDRLR